jgi:hypothetical protein
VPSHYKSAGSELNNAASHLREPFQAWLGSYEPDRLHEIDIRPVASLLDALADCTDVLPADYCDQLDIPKGSTYAQAVEVLRQASQATTRKSQSTAQQESSQWAGNYGFRVPLPKLPPAELIREGVATKDMKIPLPTP